MTNPALVFDHDGTLVDSEKLHFQCWRQVMSKYDVDVTEQEYIQHHNGIPTLRNAEVFIETYDLAFSPEQICQEKESLFGEMSLRTPSPMIDTVMDTLRAARDEGFKMAIATGAGINDVERSVKAHGLAPYFDAVATRTDVEFGKPAPDVYLLACERLEANPAESVAFEDTAAGIASAQAAGLFCIAVPNAYSMLQDLSAADAQCSNLWAAFQLAKSRIST